MNGHATLTLTGRLPDVHGVWLCPAAFLPVLQASMAWLVLGGLLPERVRAISIARLRTLPPLHLRPIDVIVSDGPLWKSYLEGGFVLRCFQHLSLPDAATRRCTWRYNRLTGGLSNTVLSY